MSESYRAALRKLMAERGDPVEINDAERERFPDFPDMWVSIYGWRDYEAVRHRRECGWIVPEGVTLTEVSYVEFADTHDDDDRKTVGINAEPAEGADIRCACGEYAGVTLRWEGSLKDALLEIFGPPGSITL